MFKPFKGSLSVMLWVASLVGLALVLGLVLNSPRQEFDRRNFSGTNFV